MLQKALRWGIVPLILVYLAASTVLYFEQRRLLYFPQHTRTTADHTDFALDRDGVVLRGWVVNPGQDHALLYFGGNGDAIQTMRDNFRRWAPGWTVYLVAYRGYGASEGEPTERALFGDAVALYDDVRTRHAGIGAMGRSLGSGVATYLASVRPIDRLALVTPYDSIAHLAQARFPLFPAELTLKDKYESWRYAPKVRCPVLVLEAEQDLTVPAWSTQRLLGFFSPPPRVIRIPHSGHGSIVDSADYAAAVTAFWQLGPVDHYFGAAKVMVNRP
ncbi:MAG: hypothetical protein P4L83_18985 [Nevskia sp.]|nr:hypothetical protein [Nevskia sp.]